MNLAIIFIPLFNFLTLSIFGRFFGKHGAKLIAPFFMVLAAALSLVAFYEVGFLGNFSYITLGTWINCGLFVVNWGFLFDSLTVTMFVVVNVVSALVHIYSVYYMSEDPFFVRFLSYLSFFTFFMLILVSADNFIQLFLGWEGVGLCSYLLINFWYTRVQANKAALKALIMNRIGDFGLTLGILLVFSIFKSVDFGTVFSLVSYLDWESFT